MASATSLHDNAKLSKTVISFGASGFALVDGAHFDDLPATLLREGLGVRSLFLDTSDSEVQKAGPWLVALDQAPFTFERLLRIVDSKPAAIFWCCEEGESVLYRHLRTLNMVLLPKWAVDKEKPPELPAKANEVAAFRHFDPRVLGAVLPVFDAPQLSRFLGPSREIVFSSADYGVKRLLRDTIWSAPSPGMLKMTSTQLAMMSDRRSRVSRDRIGRYLRAYAPAHTQGLNDDDLSHVVARYFDQASDMGATTERSIGIWSYLQITSYRDLSRDGFAGTFLADRRNGVDVDARIQAYLLARSKSAA